MATNKRLMELKDKFERNVNIFKNLKAKQESGEIDEVETKKLKEIQVAVSEVMVEAKTLSALPSSTNSAISKISNIDNGLRTIFTHTPVAPTKAPINKKWSAVKTDETTLLPKYEKVSNNLAIGTDKHTFGVVDDLLNYNGQPTLKLEKLSSSTNRPSSLTNSEIGSQYSISFVFKLNRFPSKSYIPGSFVKRVITRRTDLLAFEYFNNKTRDTLGGCKIEFGAMAPYGRYNKNQQQINENGAMPNECLEFKHQYSPFSIAANITNNNFGGSMSIYTDYKFELGKEYHVTLLITKTNNMNTEPFGAQDSYEISLSVNNVNENTAIVKGKAWGSKMKSLIARKPNFLLEGSSEYLKTIDSEKWNSIYNQPSHKVTLGFMNVRFLKTITSPPNIMKTNNSDDQKMFIPNMFKFNKTVTRKHLHKINNGVDIGVIDIATGGSRGKIKNPKG
jgi:hypothetical protein